jgi:serine/threonine-protein kinase
VSAPALGPEATAPGGVPRLIGGAYVVCGLLGEGGMGIVVEARHTTTGRAVAVKVLHAAQAGKPSAQRRFQREVRAAAATGHPNICAVLDSGRLEDGRPYLVMEKLAGRTLADRIATEGGLPLEDVVDILDQVLSGLGAAHDKGIVHRDIKPQNVFLAETGGTPRVKLLDFGVSKIVSPAPVREKTADETEITRRGMVVGTPYYLSPEQVLGERDLDARVDLYACGVVLYESLTGLLPFTAPSYKALLGRILSGRPRPAREVRPALPLAFDPILARAMALSRDDRYASAAELRRDLLAAWPRPGGGAALPAPLAPDADGDPTEVDPAGARQA